MSFVPLCVTVNPACVLCLNVCVYSAVVYVNLCCSVFTLSDTPSLSLCVCILYVAVCVRMCVCVILSVSRRGSVSPTQSAESLYIRTRVSTINCPQGLGTRSTVHLHAKPHNTYSMIPSLQLLILMLAT